MKTVIATLARRPTTENSATAITTLRGLPDHPTVTKASQETRAKIAKLDVAITAPEWSLLDGRGGTTSSTGGSTPRGTTVSSFSALALRSS